MTVVELLIVISLVAMLAAILIPVASVVERKARLSQCKNNLHQIHTAITMYTGEYHMRIPLGAADGGPTADAWRNGEREGLGLLHDRDDVNGPRSYLDDIQVLYCPASEHTDKGSSTGMASFMDVGSTTKVSFLYRGPATRLINLEQLFDRAIVVDLNFGATLDGRVNHGGEILNILCGDGAIQDARNPNDEYNVMVEDDREEMLRVLDAADYVCRSIGAADEEPTP